MPLSCATVNAKLLMLGCLLTARRPAGQNIAATTMLTVTQRQGPGNLAVSPPSQDHGVYLNYRTVRCATSDEWNAACICSCIAQTRNRAGSAVHIYALLRFIGHDSLALSLDCLLVVGVGRVGAQSDGRIRPLVDFQAFRMRSVARLADVSG